MPRPVVQPIEAELTGVKLLAPNGKERILSSDRLRNLPAATMAALAEKFGAQKITQLMDELCAATCITAGGREIPDNRTRLAAATLVLAYLVGRPVERQEIISLNLDADNMTGLRERLAASPAMRQTLAGLLQEVEGEAVEVEK